MQRFADARSARDRLFDFRLAVALLPISVLAPRLVAEGSSARGERPGQENEQLDGARVLFEKNCASCHGANGDGQGTTELDRPARSFKDGGFSFGNTPEALFRTLSNGIPGTPMPGFSSSLSEEERRVLADYVVTLGPPFTPVKEEDTILTVSDRPRVVRGACCLPSPTARSNDRERSRSERPTACLSSTGPTTCACSECAWVPSSNAPIGPDAGGTAIEPLGRTVYTLRDGHPEATFLHGDGPGEALPARARLAGTWVVGHQAGLRYRVQTESGTVAHVAESVAAAATSIGAGFRRQFVITGLDRGTLWLRFFDQAEVELVAEAEGDEHLWLILRRADGTLEAVGGFAPDLAPRAEDGQESVRSKGLIELAARGANASYAIDVVTLTLVSKVWSADQLVLLDEISQR